MKRRTAGVVIAVLAVCCLALVLAAVYPFAAMEPQANDDDETFTVAEVAEYSATGSVVVDGETQLAFEGTVAERGGWYQRVEQDGVTSEEYRAEANGTVFERLEIEDEADAEQRRELIEDDEERTLLEERHDDDAVTLVVEESSAADEPVTGTAMVFVNSLELVAYEPVDGSTEATVYEPKAGWYDGARDYRITSASGDVRVDAETSAVESADVSWELTVAGTYAEYALVRLTSDEPATHHISFEFDADDTELAEPAWVDEHAE